MTRAISKDKPMCCVDIGFVKVLLPIDKGLKLVELLQHAVQCEKDFTERDYVYCVRGEPLRSGLTMVTADQIRMPNNGAAQQVPAPRKLLK